MRFEDLNIKKKYIEILDKSYIYNPTKVQEETIPVILKGRNSIVKSQTGTGKTLAFVLPILQRVNKDIKTVQSMILTPTRELANQIIDVIESFIKDDDIKSVSLVGGHDYQKQEKKINSSQIIVGTPGRILDHISKGNINLKHLKSVVIDEADQMLVYDFLESIEILSSKVPKGVQYSLFSATMPTKVVSLSKKIIINPVKINISQSNHITDNVKQYFINTDEKFKYKAFCTAIDILNPFMAIVFCKSKESADTLYSNMSTDGYSCDITHGDFSQKKRETTLNNFRKMKFVYLITTDLSARGFDIDGVTHVINYDLPSHSTYYVHRIGRTGRMDNTGIAINFVIPSEKKKEERIAKLIKDKIIRINYMNKNDEINFRKKIEQIKEEN